MSKKIYIQDVTTKEFVANLKQAQGAMVFGKTKDFTKAHCFTEEEYKNFMYNHNIIYKKSPFFKRYEPETKTN